MYPNLNIDIDLVLFGALLHDIGKTNEYNDFLEEENYIARKGNGAELLGHSYEGVHIVDNYLSKYDIEVEFKNQVLHMIMPKNEKLINFQKQKDLIINH